VRRAEISVAITTRDRPEALARCLASLRAGRVLPAEVVVADQSSGTQARAVVSGAEARWVDGGEGGLAGGQNVAFRHTTMPVIAVLDDDCVADPAWIEELERAFAADAGLALVGGRVVPLPASGDRAFPVASRTSTRRRELGRHSAPWNVGSGNNFAIRRDWFERVGGGDERLGPGTAGQGGLDLDLFYRVLRAGGRARYEPGAVVHHEPATRAGRLERRRPYGYGMGVACALRLREGDPYAAALLARWLALRLRVLAGGLLDRRREAPREEALLLGGTAAGVLHGLRRPPDGLWMRRRRDAR
jgi:GT2 family glycosyltransferase